MLQAWTDYPLGVAWEVTAKGPLHRLKRVAVVSYDGDKYATVIFRGKRYEVKLGYLFRDEQLSSPLLHWSVEVRVLPRT